MDERELRTVSIAYRTFQVPKQGGGWRDISAPEQPLRKVQRLILTRLVARPAIHPLALGFERGHSTVEHAARHTSQAVVLRMDIQDFFGSTDAGRISRLFADLGWDPEATGLLLSLTTYRNALPQGAPTSPRLSNLVNRRVDARLAAMAAKVGATYTRYADDMTFSFPTDDVRAVHAVIRLTKQVVGDEGYVLHERRKLHIRRRHQRQVVGGLVVNVRPQLTRERRRWLRAVEHRASKGLPTTVSATQLAGWRAYRAMVSATGSNRP